MIAEILELAGRLPFDLYRGLSDARSRRNDWMHGMEHRISHEDAAEAVAVARELLVRRYALDLELPLVLQIRNP